MRRAGYRNHPGTSGDYFDAPVHINTLGLRGAEIPAVLEIFQSGHPRYASRDPASLVNSAMDSHPNVEGNVMWAELLHGALREHLGAWRY